MDEIDDMAVAGVTATLVRAFELGDATRAAGLDCFQRRFDGGSDGRIPGTVRIDEYGDVAVREGRAGRRAGQKLLDSGTYLAVFRRQRDGGRRGAIVTWNSDSG